MGLRQAMQSRLLLDALALTGMIAAGNLAQLVTLPHVTRALSPAEWGRAAWALVIVGYFVIVMDWGYSWRGTARVAALRHDRQRLSQFLVAGWAVQAGLALVSVLAITGLTFALRGLAPFRAYVGYADWLLVAGVIFPIWLPFGLERTRELALVQFATRVGSVPLILAFVRGPGDGPVVLAAMAVAQTVAGGLGLLWMLRTFDMAWQWPDIAQMRGEVLGGGGVLTSRVWAMAYTTAIPSVLGAIGGTAALGCYMLADRIRAGVVALILPMVQAAMPRISYLLGHDRAAAHRLFGQWYAALAAIAGLASVVLFGLAGRIIALVGGPAFAASAGILRWFAVLPLLTMTSNALGVQVLIPSGRTRVYNAVLIGAGLVSAAVMVPLIRRFGATGGAVTMVIGELTAALALGGYTGWIVARGEA